MTTEPIWDSLVNKYRDSYTQCPTIVTWSFLLVLGRLGVNRCQDCGKDPYGDDEIEYSYEVERYLCDTCYDKRGLSE